MLLHRAQAVAPTSRGDAPPREGLFGVKCGELTLLGGKRDPGEAGPSATALREFDEEVGGRLVAEEWAALAAVLASADEAAAAEGIAPDDSLRGSVGVLAHAAAAAAGAAEVVKVRRLVPAEAMRLLSKPPTTLPAHRSCGSAVVGHTHLSTSSS